MAAGRTASPLLLLLLVALLLAGRVHPSLGSTTYTPQIHTASDLLPRLPGWTNVDNRMPPCSFVYWDLGADCQIQCEILVSFSATSGLLAMALRPPVFGDFRTWVTGVPVLQRNSSMGAGGCRQGSNPGLNASLWQTQAKKMESKILIKLESQVYLVLFNPTARNVPTFYALTGDALVVKPYVYDTHDVDHITDISSGIYPWISSTVGEFAGTDFLHDGNDHKGLLAIQYDLLVTYTGLYTLAIENPSAFSDSATNAWYTITDDAGSYTLIWDQQVGPYGTDEYTTVGNFYFTAGTGTVTLRNDYSNGRVVADSLRLTYVQPNAPTPCTPNPCQHGGVCHALIGRYTCTCAAGYDGKYCQYTIPANATYHSTYWMYTEHLLHLGAAYSDRIDDPVANVNYDYLGGETTIRPKGGQTIVIPGGTTTPLRWTPLTQTGGLWGNIANTNFIQYWALAVWFPEDTDFRFGFSHDDDVRGWFDGTLVITANGADNGVHKQSPAVTATAGWHQCLFKLRQSTGSAYFSVSFDKPVWWGYWIPP